MNHLVKRLTQLPQFLLITAVMIIKPIIRKRHRQPMGNSDSSPLDAVPVASIATDSSSVPGCYSVDGRVSYRCTAQTVRLLAVHLPTMQKSEKLLRYGEVVSMRPFEAHVFIADQLPDDRIPVEKISGDSFSYSFDIDTECEYFIPSDFGLNERKMKASEALLRFAVFSGDDKSMTYRRFSSTLWAVNGICRLLIHSEFERALLLGMAFDLMNWLSPERRPRFSMAFGAYRRIFSPSGAGYHDIRATEIGSDCIVFAATQHETHHGSEDDMRLPDVKIEENVLVGGRAVLEVGTGMWIKKYSWIAPRAFILKHEHRPEGGGQFCRSVEHSIDSSSEIGPYAWIGQDAMILPQTFYIGFGSTIAARSVVARSVGDFAIVAGNPARTIRYNIELAERLQQDLQGIDPGDSVDEAPVPYGRLKKEMSPGSDTVFIIGSEDESNIISAARHYRRVFAVDCCSRSIVSLLRGLEAEGLRNVILQSNNMSLIHEINRQRSFHAILLFGKEPTKSVTLDVMNSIFSNSGAIYTLKNAAIPSELLASQWLSAMPVDDNHTLFVCSDSEELSEIFDTGMPRLRCIERS